MLVAALISEGSRSGLLAECFLGGLGYQGQTKSFVEGDIVFWGLAAEGGKARKPVLSWKFEVYVALVPQASKKPLGQYTTTGSL